MNAEPAWLTSWQAQPRAITTHHEGPIVTRQEAVARGLKLYFTGEPCLRGHIAERYIKKGCVACHREQRKASHALKTPATPEQARRVRLVHEESRGPVPPPLPADPPSWPDDGGARREPVVDPLTKRVIRKVGWVNCLGRFSVSKPHRFFSPDVTKVRMCCRCKTPVYLHDTD